MYCQEDSGPINSHARQVVTAAVWLATGFFLSVVGGLPGKYVPHYNMYVQYIPCLLLVGGMFLSSFLNLEYGKVEYMLPTYMPILRTYIHRMLSAVLVQIEYIYIYSTFDV